MRACYVLVVAIAVILSSSEVVVALEALGYAELSKMTSDDVPHSVNAEKVDSKRLLRSYGMSNLNDEVDEERMVKFKSLEHIDEVFDMKGLTKNLIRRGPTTISALEKYSAACSTRRRLMSYLAPCLRI